MKLASTLLLPVLFACSNPPKQNKPIAIPELGVTITAGSVSATSLDASVRVWTLANDLTSLEILTLRNDVNLEPPPGSAVVADAVVDGRRLLEYRHGGGWYFRLFDTDGPTKLACSASMMGGVTVSSSPDRGKPQHEFAHERYVRYSLAKAACMSMRRTSAEAHASR